MATNDEIRQLLEQRKQHRDENGRFAKKSVFEVAQELGVDTNDLRIRDLASRGDALEDVEKEVLRTAVKIHYTQPTDADMPSQVAKSLPSLPEQERLMQEYREGSKGLSGNALIRYKMRMRQKGLEIS